MAGTTPPGARLVAIDGSRGKDVAAAAEALAARLRDREVPCGVSRWDASGLFTDLAAAEPGQGLVAPRVLALVYAADLAFRLRWEIRPALAAGAVVIAAPYVETAVAVGMANGLDERWLRDVLRFAIAPGERALARERKTGRGWKRKPSRGYAEFCAALLQAAPDGLTRQKARQAAVAWLAGSAGKGVATLTKRGLTDLAERLTDSLKAAAAPSGARPRSARK